MITISGCICYINSELGLVNLIKFDQNNHIITLSVITLSGFHCTLKILTNKSIEITHELRFVCDSFFEIVEFQKCSEQRKVAR